MAKGTLGDEKDMWHDEESLRNLLDSMPQLVWTAKPDGTIDYYNRRVEQYSGISKESDGWKWGPVVHPDDAKRTGEAWKRSVSTGETYEIEHRVKVRNGEYRWILSRGVPAFDEHGKICRWFGTATDIHRQKIAEIELEKAKEEIALSEGKFRTVFRQAPLAIVISRMSDGHILEANDAYQEMFGYSLDEMQGKTYEELGIWVDPEQRTMLVKQLLQKGFLPPTEYTYRKKGGRVSYGMMSAGIIISGGESLILAETFDITDRKRAEEELSRLNYQRQAILDTVADGVIVYDRRGNVLYSNNLSAEYLGYDSSEALQKVSTITEIYRHLSRDIIILDTSGMDFPLERMPSQRVLAGEGYAEQQLRFIHRGTGQDYWLNVKSRPYYDSEDRLQMIVTILSDITRLKRIQMSAEEDRVRIEKAKREWETTFDAVTDMIFITDSDGDIKRCNLAAKDFYGMSFRDLLGRKLSDIMPLPSIQTKDERPNIFVKGKWFSMSQYPLLLSGNESGAVFLFSDVTDMMELDKKKSEFMGIASHELKTPITGIKMYVQLLQRILAKEGSSQALQFLEVINSQVDNVAQLINDLLDITRIEEGKLKLKKISFDLNALVSEVAEEWRRTTDSHAILAELGDDVQIYADRERMKQVITNLMSNAVKYSPGADRIVVVTSRIGDSISLSIEDFGIGIPDNMKDKVFDRFYRIEQRTNLSGLGLGLYIVSEIVKRHGGHIQLDSTEGKGSKFTVVIPRSLENEKDNDH